MLNKDEKCDVYHLSNCYYRSGWLFHVWSYLHIFYTKEVKKRFMVSPKESGMGEESMASKAEETLDSIIGLEDPKLIEYWKNGGSSSTRHNCFGKYNQKEDDWGCDMLISSKVPGCVVCKNTVKGLHMGTLKSNVVTVGQCKKCGRLFRVDGWEYSLCMDCMKGLEDKFKQSEATLDEIVGLYEYELP